MGEIFGKTNCQPGRRRERKLLPSSSLRGRKRNTGWGKRKNKKRADNLWRGKRTKTGVCAWRRFPRDLFLGNSFWSLCLSVRRLYIPRSWFFCLFSGFSGFFLFQVGVSVSLFPLCAYREKRRKREGKGEGWKGDFEVFGYRLPFLFSARKMSMMPNTLTSSPVHAEASLGIPFSLLLLALLDLISASSKSYCINETFFLYQLLELAHLIFGLLIPSPLTPSPFVSLSFCECLHTECNTGGSATGVFLGFVFLR